jgi:uncharacterized membrane protein YgcG
MLFTVLVFFDLVLFDFCGFHIHRLRSFILPLRQKLILPILGLETQSSRSPHGGFGIFDHCGTSPGGGGAGSEPSEHC